MTFKLYFKFQKITIKTSLVQYLLLLVLIFFFSSKPLECADSNPSFDCSKAALLVEELICSDYELGSMDQELATLYHRHLQREENQAKARQRQLNFLKHRNARLQESLKYDLSREQLIDQVKYVYKARINYFRRALNPPSNYMREWINLDKGQRDPCRGQYHSCDVRRFGFKGVWGNDRILWYPDLWLHLDEGDPDPCFGIYNYAYCNFKGNIIDENWILLKPTR
jgi:uncharacterized protein